MGGLQPDFGSSLSCYSIHSTRISPPNRPSLLSFATHSANGSLRFHSASSSVEPRALTFGTSSMNATNPPSAYRITLPVEAVFPPQSVRKTRRMPEPCRRSILVSCRCERFAHDPASTRQRARPGCLRRQNSQAWKISDTVDAFVSEADAQELLTRVIALAPSGHSRHIITVLGKAQLGHTTTVAFQFDDFDQVKAEPQHVWCELPRYTSRGGVPLSRESTPHKAFRSSCGCSRGDRRAVSAPKAPHRWESRASSFSRLCAGRRLVRREHYVSFRFTSSSSSSSPSS